VSKGSTPRPIKDRSDYDRRYAGIKWKSTKKGKKPCPK